MRGLWLTLCLVACGPTIGDQCTTASQCAGQLCLTRLDTPGGYCSKSCVVGDADSCPLGSVCHSAGNGLGLPSCYRVCKQQTDCREGYECRVVPSAPTPVCAAG
jgi:hypothetical protein